MLGRMLDTPPENDRSRASKTAIAKVLHTALWSGRAALTGRNAARTASCEAPRRALRSMIFADFADYSRLRDGQVDGFLELLAGVGSALETVRAPGSYIRTMGDGIFAVMFRANEAIDFALTLNRAVEAGNRSVRNLDIAMHVRIGLHAGPVILAKDPVTKMPAFYGSHVNRAARLEQVTAPGHIYATTEFIECLRREAPNQRRGLVEGGSGWVCEYFGIVNLPKNFGTQSVYEVRELGTAGTTS